MLDTPRSGTRPRMSDDGPHRQVDQVAPPALWGTLVARVFNLPGVSEGISQVSPASSRAVFFDDGIVASTPSRSLAPHGHLEPVHVHGVEDTSLHLVLPAGRGAQLVELGWAEPHQYADFGTEYMVYGPRDEDELDAVFSIIQESLDFARS